MISYYGNNINIIAIKSGEKMSG